jgi:hypothetical protein
VLEETPGYIVPLQFNYAHWDHHYLQWLPDHPRYEMVEALIDDSEPAKTFFFLTERQAEQGSKKQHCYTDNLQLYEALQMGGGDRESHHVEIAYEKVEDTSPTRIQLELDAVDGHVVWGFSPSTETSADYASGLIDNIEAGHDLKGGILAFYLPETAVSDEKTTLSIGDEKYPAQLWPEISKPPYFTAYRGVHSRDVHNGYFVASPLARSEYRSWPDELEVGSHWKTHTTVESRDVRYDTLVVVTALEGDTVQIAEEWGLRYEVIRSGDALLTRALSYVDDDASMRVEFEPPLPDLRFVKSGETTAAFTVSLGDHVAVIEGNVIIASTDDHIELLLAPETPEWTRQIRLRATIRPMSSGYTYESVTEYPQR